MFLTVIVRASDVFPAFTGPKLTDMGLTEITGFPVGAKVAVAVLSASIVTVHVIDVPAQLPPQPVNVEPAEGAAVRVASVP